MLNIRFLIRKICILHYKTLYLRHLIYDFEDFNEIVRGWLHPASTSFYETNIFIRFVWTFDGIYLFLRKTTLRLP